MNGFAKTTIEKLVYKSVSNLCALEVNLTFGQKNILGPQSLYYNDEQKMNMYITFIKEIGWQSYFVILNI